MSEIKAYALSIDNDEMFELITIPEMEKQFFETVKSLEGFYGVHNSMMDVKQYLLFDTDESRGKAYQKLKKLCPSCKIVKEAAYFDGSYITRH